MRTTAQGAAKRPGGRGDIRGCGSHGNRSDLHLSFALHRLGHQRLLPIVAVPLLHERDLRTTTPLLLRLHLQRGCALVACMTHVCH